MNIIKLYLVWRIYTLYKCLVLPSISKFINEVFIIYFGAILNPVTMDTCENRTNS